MDMVYDFSWIVPEIDQSIVLKLMDGDKLIGIYQVNDIGYDLDDIEVKFANIADLEKFILHSAVIFRDVNNDDNMIRIPFRKMLLLFNKANELTDRKEKNIDLNDVEAFIINNGQLVKDDYQIVSMKVNDEGEELKEIMEIAYNYGNLGMNDKIDALGKINLVNYHKSKVTRSA